MQVNIIGYIFFSHSLSAAAVATLNDDYCLRKADHRDDKMSTNWMQGSLTPVVQV